MHKFPDTYSLPKLNEEDINNFNRSIARMRLKQYWKLSPQRKNLELDGLTAGFYQTFTDDLTLIFLSKHYPDTQAI